MKAVTTNFAVIVLVLGLLVSAEQCKDSFSDLGDHCYHVHGVGDAQGYGSTSWMQANDYCQSLDQSAHLIVEKDTAKLLRVLQEHISPHFNYGGPLYVYIGATIFTQSIEWIDGQPMSHWRNCTEADVMYDASVTGSCARLTYSMASFTGDYSQDLCLSYSDCHTQGVMTSAQNFVLCQYKKASNFSPLCPSNWIHGPDGESCFHFGQIIRPEEHGDLGNTMKRTWNELYCEATQHQIQTNLDGRKVAGSLATFNNVMEFIWMQKHALPMLQHYELGVGLRVGLTNQTSASFIWVDGSNRQNYLEDDSNLPVYPGNLCASLIASPVQQLGAVFHHVHCTNPSTEPYIFSIRKHSHVDKSLERFISKSTNSDACREIVAAHECHGHGKKQCSCIPGYTGHNCDQEIDRCSSAVDGFMPVTTIGDLCSQHGTCESSPQGAYCVCNEGYEGPLCQSVFTCSLVLNNNCTALAPETHHHVTATDRPEVTGECSGHGTHQCVCHAGYTGVGCETETNQCHQVVDLLGRNTTFSALCQPHGTCVPDGSTAQCQCQSGFTGIFCQQSIPGESFCGQRCMMSDSFTACPPGQLCVQTTNSTGWCLPNN